MLVQLEGHTSCIVLVSVCMHQINEAGRQIVRVCVCVESVHHMSVNVGYQG